MDKFAYRKGRRFTREQCRKGGVNRWANRLPVDPEDERIFPLPPNTWQSSVIYVDRVFGRWTQYDVITTGNERTKRILSDGVQLPFSSYTELFDAMRRAASMGVIQD